MTTARTSKTFRQISHPGNACLDIWLQTLPSGVQGEEKRDKLYKFVSDTVAHYVKAGQPAWHSALPGGVPTKIGQGASALCCRVEQVQQNLVVVTSSNDEFGLNFTSLNRTVRWHLLADRFFSPGEMSEMISVPHFGKTRRFLQIWSLKMAYQQALRKGDPGDLEELDISFNRAGCIRIGSTRQDKATYGSFVQFELPGDLLISANVALPSAFQNTFRFFKLNANGVAERVRPLAFRRSQPVHKSGMAGWRGKPVEQHV